MSKNVKKVCLVCNPPPPIISPPPKNLLTAKELEIHYYEWYNSLDG